MKHIKEYTLFEGVYKETKIFESNDFDDIRQTLNDICLDLNDDGFLTVVNCTPKGFFVGNTDSYTYDIPEGRYGYIYIRREQIKSHYSFSEVNDAVNRIKSYLSNRRIYLRIKPVYSKTMVGSEKYIPYDNDVKFEGTPDITSLVIFFK